jgi:hypothetical protein
LFGVESGEFEVEAEELAAFVVGLFADVEFEQFAFDGFLLVEGVEVCVEVFEGAQILLFDFGLGRCRGTGACAIWSGWMCLKNSARRGRTLNWVV